MHYDGSYYRIALIDVTYGVIDDGKEVITYHPDGYNMPLTIKNDIGIGMIMPVRIDNESELDRDKIVAVE